MTRHEYQCQHNHRSYSTSHESTECAWVDPQNFTQTLEEIWNHIGTHARDDQTESANDSRSTFSTAANFRAEFSSAKITCQRLLHRTLPNNPQPLSSFAATHT